ncbi:hypothetical protein [Cupriavidus pauculus]|uniref:hypothetical protein n=1 Tax=Cupriavidus pauculus TaxID=82633 RepID=UPI001D0C697E|nr:hypothetical protein [Cupriavidus pauculus]
MMTVPKRKPAPKPAAKTGGRPRVDPNKVMTTAERMARNEDSKRRAGAKRISGWISPEAAVRLGHLQQTAGEPMTVSDVLNEVLLGYRRK